MGQSCARAVSISSWDGSTPLLPFYWYGSYDLLNGCGIIGNYWELLGIIANFRHLRRQSISKNSAAMPGMSLTAGSGGL
jgi:hypothetical protein